MQALKLISENTGIDYLDLFSTSLFQNVSFKDPTTGRRGDFRMRIIEGMDEGIEAGRYDLMNLPAIFHTPLVIHPTSLWLIHNQIPPNMSNLSDRSKETAHAGTSILLPSIESLPSEPFNVFIPESESFCIERIYNRIKGTDRYSFVRRCLSIWGNQLVVQPEEECLEFMRHRRGRATSIELAEHLIGRGIKPLLNTKANFNIKTNKKKKGVAGPVGPRRNIIHLYPNGYRALNLHVCYEVFGEDVHWYCTRRGVIRAPEEGRKKDPVPVSFNNGQGHWVIISYYFIRVSSSEIDIVVVSPTRSGDMYDREKYLKIITHSARDHDVFHKNVVHTAAIRWTREDLDFKEVLLHAYSNPECYKCSSPIPDEIEQVICEKLSNHDKKPDLIPVYKFKKDGVDKIKQIWDITYIYDIETTQKEEHQRSLHSLDDCDYKDYPVYPYAIDGYRMIIPWDSGYEETPEGGSMGNRYMNYCSHYDFKQRKFLYDPDEVRFYDDFRTRDSIWDYDLVKRKYEEQWQDRHKKGVYPKGYIKEYWTEQDVGSEFSPITRFLAKITCEVLEILCRVYEASKPIPSKVRINLCAYNGARFDHQHILQDNFWYLYLDYRHPEISLFKEGVVKHFIMNGWESAIILGSWSHIKGVRGLHTTVQFMTEKKKEVIIEFYFTDPLNFIGDKVSLDEYTKDLVPSHCDRKKGINHDEINMSNILEKKEEIQHYLKFDIYLLGLALIDVMNTMIIMMNEAAKPLFDENEPGLWSRGNFGVPPRIEQWLDSGGRPHAKPITNVFKVEDCYGLPPGYTMHSLQIVSPLKFLTNPSTARKFLQWSNMNVYMATQGIRHYFRSALMGGRCQLVRRKYENSEMKKLDKKFDDIFIGKSFCDLQFLQYQKAKKGVTGCLYDDYFQMVKEREIESKEVIRKETVKKEQFTWDIPDDMLLYLNNEKEKSTDLLPEHFQIPMRTQLCEWTVTEIHNGREYDVHLQLQDEPLEDLDANSLYPSAYVMQPLHTGKMFSWSKYQEMKVISLLTPEDFIRADVFGVITYDWMISTKSTQLYAYSC